MGMIFLNGNEYTSSPKDGFPPIIYSDEEREIGVWRDGKPLYQKVFQSTITGDGNNEIASIAGLNVDNYYVTEAFLLTSNASIPSGYNNGSNTAYFYVYTRTSDDTIRAISKGYTNAVVYIVFQYTKTTDTAGSGKYTTYGGLAHHYSTSEQVIGTWIDGKPIYEKAFQIIVNDSTYSGFIRQVTEQELGIAYSSIDSIISLRAIYGKNIVMPRNRIKSTWSESVCVSDNKIIFEASHEVSNTTVSFIVQYTKTTD